MTTLQQLENKIRETLPYLKEIGVGLEFIDSLGFNAKIVFIDSNVHYFSESDNEIFYETYNFFPNVCDEVIGHPIMLNDVLLWHSLDRRDKYSHFEVNKGDGYFSIYDGEEVQSVGWNLSSSYLSEQSDELIEFLNGL